MFSSGCVCVCVYVIVSRIMQKTLKQIGMKLGGMMRFGSEKEPLHVGADQGAGPVIC